MKKIILILIMLLLFVNIAEAKIIKDINNNKHNINLTITNNILSIQDQFNIIPFISIDNVEYELNDLISINPETKLDIPLEQKDINSYKFSFNLSKLDSIMNKIYYVGYKLSNYKSIFSIENNLIINDIYTIDNSDLINSGFILNITNNRVEIYGDLKKSNLWLDPTITKGTQTSSPNRLLVKNSKGYLYNFIYNDSKTYLLYESIDNGNTWRLNLSIKSNAALMADSMLEIAIDSQDNLHLIYVNATTNKESIDYTRFNLTSGTIFTSMLIRNGTAKNPSSPNIFISSNNTLYVLGTLSGTKYSVYSTNYGSTWSSNITIDNGFRTSTQAMTSAIFDLNNTLIMGMEMQYPSGQGIRIYNYTIGDGWKYIRDFNVSTSAREPCLVMNSKGEITIFAYTKIYTLFHHSFINYSILDGWSGYYNITSQNNTKQTWASCGIDNLDNIHLLYSNSTSLFYVNSTNLSHEYVISNGQNINPRMRYSQYPYFNIINGSIDYITYNTTSNPVYIFFNSFNISNSLGGDTTPPTVSNFGVNNTSPRFNDYYNVSLSVSDETAMSVVWYQKENSSGKYNLSFTSGGNINVNVVNTERYGEAVNLTGYGNDTSGNMVKSSTVTLNIANTLPTISSLTPADSTVFTHTQNINFTGTYADNDLSSGNCILYINSSSAWNASASNGSITTGSSFSLMMNNTLSEGYWRWYINCSDGTNTTMSNILTFSISIPIPSSGGGSSSGGGGVGDGQGGFTLEKIKTLTQQPIQKQEKSFLDKFFSNERQLNGVCDDGETFGFDDDCVFTMSMIRDKSILTYAGTYRILTFLTIIMFIFRRQWFIEQNIIYTIMILFTYYFIQI